MDSTGIYGHVISTHIIEEAADLMEEVIMNMGIPFIKRLSQCSICTTEKDTRKCSA